jgi:hypothetical protein
MVKLLKTMGCSILGLVATQINALNPTPGIYAGVLVGASGELSSNASYLSPFLNFQVDTQTEFGQRIQALIDQYQYRNPNRDLTLTYNILGQIGGQIGYRWDRFRLEGQIFYNSAPYKSFKVTNGVNTVSLSNDDTQENYFSGSTNTFALMMNAYFDLLPPDYVDTNFAPFIGIGGGYARVNNNFQFYVQGQQINQYRETRTQGAAAGQVMAGVLYFLDDFSNFGIDFRFFSTANISPNIAAQMAQYNIQTPSQGLSYNAQIASINLTFNGALNLG